MNRFQSNDVHLWQESVNLEQFNEIGVAIVEFAICIPLLLFLFLATLEIAQLLRVTQVTNVLSREAGNVAFRYCADFAEPSGLAATQSRTADCLQQVLQGANGVQTIAASLGLPFEFEIIVSIFRYDDTGNPGSPSLWLVSSLDGCPDCAIGASKFTISRGRPELDGPNVVVPPSEVMAQQRFVVSEVYVRYSKMTAEAFSHFIPSDGQGKAIYYEQTTF
jgi:TadE-like protein